MNNPLIHKNTPETMQWLPTGEEMGQYSIEITSTLAATAEIVETIELNITVTTLALK